MSTVVLAPNRPMMHSASATPRCNLMPPPLPRCMASSLARPGMRRGGSAPPRPVRVVRAAVVVPSQPQPAQAVAAVAAAASSVTSAPVAAAAVAVPTAAVAVSATAAHVLHDTASMDLTQRLQNRLSSLGIGPGTLSVEVRSMQASSASASSQSFSLHLTGRLGMGVGSLFNMLLHGFLRQHPQIRSVERNIRFVHGSVAGASATDASSSSASGAECSDEDDELVDRACLPDSDPILRLKVAHVAKLLHASRAALVLVGDQLCHTAATPADSSAPSPLASLEVPHPPSLLKRWVRDGTVSHIVTESSDGAFNPSGKRGDGMSDDDSSQSDAPLRDDQLSELYGNRFVEICTAACGAGRVYRDFEVKRPRLAPASTVPGASAQNSSQDAQNSHLTGRQCDDCQAPLRDTLVEWNEPLPRSVLQRAASHAANADLVLVLGSSLREGPLADLALSPCSGSSAPVVLVGSRPGAKDAAVLRAGGLILRRDVASVLGLLSAELETLKRTPMQATVVRKIGGKVPAVAAAATVAQAAVAPAAVTPAPAAFHRATALERPQMKKRSVAQLVAQMQRRSSALLSVGSSQPGLSRPTMQRAATAAPGLLSLDARARAAARRMAALPPFPRLDDDDDEESSSPPVPAASAPSRAASEEVFSLSLSARRMAHAFPPSPVVGEGSLVFSSPAVHLGSRLTSLSPPPLLVAPGSLSLPDLPPLPNVSSPISASRFSSLSAPIPASRFNSLSPPDWPPFPAFSVNAPSTPLPDLNSPLAALAAVASQPQATEKSGTVAMSDA